MKHIFSTLFLVFVFSCSYAQPATNLIISQIYGGTGCGTPGCAAYKNDFIEIFNPTKDTVNISTWAVQFASASDNDWTMVPLSGKLAPGQYFLIAGPLDNNGVKSLPTPDATTTARVSTSNGTVIITRNLIALHECPVTPTGSGTFVDLVAYGNSNCFDIFPQAPSPSTTLSILRVDKCSDSDAGTDFITAQPTPRNSAVAASSCFSLPITLESFSASRNGKSNNINWKVNCTSVSVTFEIERSTDGRTFQKIHRETASQARCAEAFTYTDNVPNNGANYYRIKIIDVDGQAKYTWVSLILNKVSGLMITGIKPTLATSQVELYIASSLNANLDLRISDIQGKLIKKLTSPIGIGDNKLTIDISSFKAGAYFISANSAGGASNVLRFVKQ